MTGYPAREDYPDAEDAARALRRPHEYALLAPEEITVMRQALADCAAVLADISQQARGLLVDACRNATPARRCPSGLIDDVSLAIRYLDFAPAQRWRS